MLISVAWDQFWFCCCQFFALPGSRLVPCGINYLFCYCQICASREQISSTLFLHFWRLSFQTIQISSLVPCIFDLLNVHNHGIVCTTPLQIPIPRSLAVLLPGRRILYWQANADGVCADDGWPPLFVFRGRSAFHLRNELVSRVGHSDFVMCIRAGFYGRLTPLVVDLPRSRHGRTIHIVVVMTGTPGERPSMISFCKICTWSWKMLFAACAGSFGFCFNRVLICLCLKSVLKLLCSLQNSFTGTVASISASVRAWGFSELLVL